MADDDLDILAWTMLGEAGGEGMQGMADVGHVVLNRLNNGRYGASIQDVALAPKQFSTWNSGEGGNNPKGRYPKDSPEFKRAREIASQVVAGTIPGPPGRPLDYNAPSVSPYWADSKAKHGTYTRNGHVFYPSVPLPPGELPEVATALSTVPTPRNAPAPVTPSIDMAQMRRISAPSQLIPDTFAGLNKPRRTLGDELAMSPVDGGQQQAPMFDGIYDERVGAVRPSGSPIDTQGMATMRSRESAPVPRLPSPQLAGRRATDPTLQAALNARNPAQLPPLPPPGGMAPSTRMVQSVPVRSGPGNLRVAQAEQAVQRSVAPPVSRPSVPPPMTVEQMYAGIYPTEPGQFRIGSTDGLGPGNPNADFSTAALTGAVGPNGLPVTAPLRTPPTPFSRPQTFPTQFAQAPRIAPTPFPRPTGVGTQLSVRPMPPMPIARPNFGMGGGERAAPVPASMSPFMAMRRSLPVLRPPTSVAARREWMTGFSDSGSSGGAHGGKSD